MNTMKKLLTLLLAGVMLLGATACGGSDEADSMSNKEDNFVIDDGKPSNTTTNGENDTVIEFTQPSEGLEFKLNSDEISYSVTGIGSCQDSDIVIPDSFAGKPVTEIGSAAFIKTYIKSVTVPGSVTSIGMEAFCKCSRLKSVTLSEGLTQIGELAFYDCASLENLNLPNSVTEIGRDAFASCVSLTNVTIPNGVKSIGYEAFAKCESLTNITIPGNLAVINDGAFADCTSLTNVVVSDGITTIGASAFRGCELLEKINIPNSVTKIDEYAFSGCTSIRQIIIPDSVTQMGYGAFKGCSSDIIVYCEAESNPLGWQAWIESRDATIYWGNEWEYVDGVPTAK